MRLVLFTAYNKQSTLISTLRLKKKKKKEETQFLKNIGL